MIMNYKKLMARQKNWLERKLKKTLKQLKNGKAVGIDKLVIEIMKANSSQTVEMLYKLLKNYDGIPIEWK